MRDVDAILDEMYVGAERVSRNEIYRRVVAAGAPAEVVDALDALPEGEYAQDEVAEALGQIGVGDGRGGSAEGVPANQLDDGDLLRELGELHRTRHDTLRHGSDRALAHHDQRLAELEGEYLRRFPQREVDPERLRAGARERTAHVQPPAQTPPAAQAAQPRTGADQPWDPEDLAVAEGRDPTPANVRRAAAQLAAEGPAAIERTVP